MSHRPKFKFTQPRYLNRREFVRLASIFVASMASGCASSRAFRGIAGDDSPSSLETPYDYIVIGSGAGGGPVAANLARAGYRVLLLEAGGRDESYNYDVPAFHPLSTEDPNLSWAFFVNHYKDAERARKDPKYVNGKGVLYPRGATLGGSTAHNAMVTLYPDDSDWENIVDLTGDRSWNPRDMRSYFEKIENARYCPDPLNLGRHGYHGWLSLEQTSPMVLKDDLKLLDMVVAAAREAGFTDLASKILTQFFNTKLDPNDWQYQIGNKPEGFGKPDGIFNIPKATENGKRSGTRKLLTDTEQACRSNFDIRTNSVATQILFEGPENRAVGVLFLEGSHLYRADPNPSSSAGIRRQARATREVIIATGAFNSPQLLMLSGIGPKADLEAKGIDARIDLPGVGQNLQDRYEMSVVSELSSDLDLLKGCTFGAPGDPCLEKWKELGPRSVYASNGVVIALIKRSKASLPDPDLCIFATPGEFRGYYPGWSKDVTQHKNRITWAILKGHTTNTAGTVRLASSDPLDPPEITFSYFDEGNGNAADDLSGIVSGIETARSIVKRWPASNVVTKELFPGPEATSGEKLDQFVKEQAWGHHASCTNKMGLRQDRMAVVDNEFKVHGTQGLRIVDASVFPKIPGLFIVVPTYMIAEKASELILKDARAKKKA